jgi:replication factor C large subunit
MLWTEKYKPKSMVEVVGQEEAKNAFLKWIKSWKPKAKAALLFGPTGVGKTAMVYAYAKENNLDVIELNASDYRTAQQIKEIIGNSLKQKSLFSKGKIFLIDEIDGLTADDKGGASEILKLMNESSYPIVFTANDPWDKKIASIRENCVAIEFGRIPYWDILKVLKKICEKEGIKHDEEVLKYIAKAADGDLRAAINDLQTISQGKKEISIKDASSLGFRERESAVFDALKLIFKTSNASAAKIAVANVDRDPEEIFWWVEQNIVNEYENKEDVAKAFDMLSLADLYLNKAKTTRSYKLMKYFIDFMTAGVALSKKQTYKKFVKYEYPSMIKYLATTKTARKDEKELILDLAKKLHCSSRKVKTQYLPFIKWLSPDDKG